MDADKVQALADLAYQRQAEGRSEAAQIHHDLIHALYPEHPCPICT